MSTKKPEGKPESKKVTFEKGVIFDGNDKKNALEALYEGAAESLPVIKSVGFMRLPDKRTFVSYVLHSRGPHVLKLEVSEPNLRAIAEDEAKIAFVQAFMDSEFDEASHVA